MKKSSPKTFSLRDATTTTTAIEKPSSTPSQAQSEPKKISATKKNISRKRPSEEISHIQPQRSTNGLNPFFAKNHQLLLDVFGNVIQAQKKFKK